MKKILHSDVTKETLLLANGILCFFYAFFYILLIVFPFSQADTKNSVYSGGVIFLNVMFLLVLTLNLNTISIIYRHISRPVKGFLRTIYFITIITWSIYVIVTYCFTFFRPGFITRFHHYVSHTFHTTGWPMLLISVIFAVGLNVLFMEYYRQVKMRHILYFIVPAILHFSFNMMLPFLLFIMGWLFFGGCQLLLYFSIIDNRQLSLPARNNFLVTGH